LKKNSSNWIVQWIGNVSQPQICAYIWHLLQEFDKIQKELESTYFIRRVASRPVNFKIAQSRKLCSYDRRTKQGWKSFQSLTLFFTKILNFSNRPSVFSRAIYFSSIYILICLSRNPVYFNPTKYDHTRGPITPKFRWVVPGIIIYIFNFKHFFKDFII
jgi:hypothetical protein